MADEKKYSAQEAAFAVLKKTEEMLKNSALMKSGNAHAEGKPDAHVPKDNSEFKPATPPDGTQTQASPEANPKEQAEGNNADWGTSPQVKGHIKLAHFMGHAGAKKVKQPNANIGTAMGQPPAEGSAESQPKK